jgi:predicted AAA+ superfamily ATPase
MCAKMSSKGDKVMTYIKRYLETIIFDSVFGRQMRFITGPRQCGKTTMAKEKLKNESSTDLYFDWESKKTREKYRNEVNFLPSNQNKKKKWVCFDEIHKMPKWKNILKGIFDTYEYNYNFMITGSARLDVLRRSGDSLTGRYFTFKLSPFILYETLQNYKSDFLPEEKSLNYVLKNVEGKKFEQEKMQNLIEFSGFPDPYINCNKVFLKKWNGEYFETIIRTDMRDLSNIQYLEKAMDLIYLLPNKIGSPVSIDSLVQDVELNHRTVGRYLNHLALNYLIFFIPPYTGNIKRLNKKAKKAYFYNYSIIEDDGLKFENFVAFELKARIDLWNDKTPDKFDIFYVKTRDGRETDFLITRNSKPYFLCEAKLSEMKIDSHHKYFSERLGQIPFIQVVQKKDVTKWEDKRFFVVSASRFFS